MSMDKMVVAMSSGTNVIKRVGNRNAGAVFAFVTVSLSHETYRTLLKVQAFLTGTQIGEADEREVVDELLVSFAIARLDDLEAFKHA